MSNSKLAAQTSKPPRRQQDGPCEDTDIVASTEAEWAIALFNRSVLKQAKYRRVLELMDESTGKTSLDIGADNGVISYLLRQRGGHWYSADLDAASVASIRQLVGSNVYQLDGGTTPFADGTFDQIVIVDFLEHISNDREFVGELARILKPRGRLIINVPHLKPRSLLNRFRHFIGLTDEWHGHLRSGYSLSGLSRLLEPHFVVERARTYSRTFSELVDTILNAGYKTLQRRRGSGPATQKGTIVTQGDMTRQRKQFLLLRALYPFFWIMAKLDALLPFQPGYKLIIQARRLDGRITESPTIIPSQ
jgi:SAM-dependent methyltransferase